MLYIQLLLFGACIGVMSGMLGIGGGIILVPGLILLFGFSQQEAQGTSLAALSLPVFIFAAALYYNSGYVRIPVAVSVAVGLMLGACLGATLVPRVPVEWLRLAFGGLLLYVGLRSIFEITSPRHAVALPAGIAALFLVVGAWLRGTRPVSSPKLPPPDGETEYHI